jgi:hypothetical protein
MDKEARQGLRRAGIQGHAEDNVKGFTEKLAEAADDVGRMTGSRSSAQKFIGGAAEVIRRSEESIRKQKRPDIYQKETNGGRGRMKIADYRRKYPGIVK